VAAIRRRRREGDEKGTLRGGEWMKEKRRGERGAEEISE
jgi:hypothetical protein